MRTTLALDDELVAKAQAFTGLKEKSALIREALKALIERESARRLARLGGSETLSVSELAQPFAMSLPAIMKHLDVLSDAGLVAREKTGRVVACRLTAKPMEQAMDWLNRYQRFWSDNLDRLAAFLEEDQWPNHQAPPSMPQDRASLSSATSARVPKKSTRRGPTRKR